MRPVRITAYSWAPGDGCSRQPPRLAFGATPEKWQRKSPTKNIIDHDRFPDTQRNARAMTKVLPIVCIPGLGCSPRLYAEQIPQLWTVGPVTIAQHGHHES